jgi:hypothetical protein
MGFQEQESHMFNSSWEIGSDIDQALAPASLVKFPKFRNFRLVENLAAIKLHLSHSTPPLSIAENKILSCNFLGIKCIKNNTFYFNLTNIALFLSDTQNTPLRRGTPVTLLIPQNGIVQA